MNDNRDQEILATATILYVEDNGEIREQLSSFLKRRVHRLLAAADGKEGLELFLQHRPEVVITDIRMPGQDGLTMARTIRENEPETPIIITTAHNDEEYFLRAIELDIDHYVLKPTDPYRLLRMLVKSLRAIRQKQEVEAANRYVRFLLDTHPNLLMVTTGDEIEYLNHPFLDHLGLTSLEELKNRQTTIRFLLPTEEERVIATSADPGWVEALLARIGTDPIVHLQWPGMSAGTESKPFAVTCNPFPAQDKYVFSFADVRQLARKMTQLEEMAFTDELTGIATRTRLRETMAKEIRRGQRYQMPISVIMFDIDHFKRVNDTYGHQTGDDVLKEIAQLVAGNIREMDLFARWGGEEFLLLSPGVTLDQAAVLAEKLRHLIHGHEFPGPGQVTCSFGVAQLQPEEEQRSLVKRVDLALYRAKEAGRNRVVVDKNEKRDIV